MSKEDDDVRDGEVSVRFDVEEVQPAPMSRLLLKRYGRAYFLSE